MRMITGLALSAILALNTAPALAQDTSKPNNRTRSSGGGHAE